jgi:thiol:disulfide interchange protein DsbD
MLFLLSTSVYASVEKSFLDPEEAFEPSVLIEGKQVIVNWKIASGYFLYRHGFDIQVGSDVKNLTKLSAFIPQGEKKYDAFFESEVETYHSAVTLTSKLEATVGIPLKAVVTSQGCADDGFCFPPTSYHFTIDAQGNGTVSTNRKDVTLNNDAALLPKQITTEVTSTPQAMNLSIGLVLTGALLGGMILNLMPCVFPVLSLKALNFAHKRDSRDMLRKHGWSYTLGVVSSFMIVGVFIISARSAGQSLGWGFQLQHPIFVTFMVYLFFVMGLSLSGAFEFGGAFMGIGQQLTSGKSVKSSFFTGVLATLVASPCTAPFMATALGVALISPAITSLLVFTTLGFGMALPLLMLSYSPDLVRWLPSPGAWMETFKQALSFPMYLTVVWLLWVISHQTSSERVILVLVGLLLIVSALWLRRFAMKSQLMKIIINAVCLALFVSALCIATHNDIRQSTNDHIEEKYSASLLHSYREQGKPVFVDLTADWCLTCKVNEKIALTPAIKQHLNSQGIAILVGDWTNKNPEITALLSQHYRSGIPLYLMYPAGNGKPEVLPQIITETMIKNAAKRALL